MDNKRRVNVRALILRDNKILAVKHKKSDGSEDEYWATPGGGLDPMETFEAGVKREVMEELGVEATVKKLLCIQQFPSSREGFDEELELFFLVEDSPAYDMVDLSKTSHGALELARIDFVDPNMVAIKPNFLSEIDLRTYAQTDLGVYVASELSL